MVWQEIRNTKRYRGKFTLIRVDFENFKILQEMYGHLHARGVFREFEIILGNSIRASDLLITFGNEKFLLVVEGTSALENNVLIERMTRNFVKWNRENGSADYRLSFRYGIAIFDGKKNLRAVAREAEADMDNTSRTRDAD